MKDQFEGPGGLGGVSEGSVPPESGLAPVREITKKEKGSRRNIMGLFQELDSLLKYRARRLRKK